jgi:nitrous oxide reductase accessory protein NosL
MIPIKGRHLLAALLVVTIALLACKKNEDATKACENQGSSDACEKCCTGEGSSGYTYVNGECSCLGG